MWYTAVVMGLIHDAIPITSRVRTPEGFLSVQAAVTRTGVLTYDASNLGLKDRTGPVKVFRTAESVFHEDTIASVRDAVLTLRHPDQLVNADNWRDVAVGNVTGSPAAIDSERLGASLIVRDKGAIDALDSGTRELSIGYEMTVVPANGAGYDYRTEGPMRVNHVALEDKGRAGPEIRVFDAKEGDMPDTLSDSDLSKIVDKVKDSLGDVIKPIVADALPKPEQGNSTPAIDADALAGKLATAVGGTLAPAFDSMKQIAEAMAQQEQQRSEAEAKTKAQDAADQLIKATLETERSRVSVLDKAKPFIPADKFEQVKDAAPKDILVAAVGATVADAANRDEQYLIGVLDAMTAGAAANRQQVTDFRQSTGVVGDAMRGNDAYSNYVKSLQDGYKGPLNQSQS